MSDIFDRAIERLRQDGLWQHTDPRTCRGTCLMLSFANDVGLGEYDKTAKRIYRVLGVTSFEEAIDWNDAPGRTLEEVVDVLRRARDLP